MFSDAYSISADARPYVAVAVERGLISGYEDDTFRGQQGITRAEAATLLWRAYQYGNDNKEFGTVETQTQAPVVITPEPIVTAAPTVTPTPKPVATATPTPEPTDTPAPEKPYVAENLVTGKFTQHCYDDVNNMVYYLDNDDNTIYKLNPETRDIDEVICLDDIYMYPDGRFLDKSETETATEDYYKKFVILEKGGLFYDNTNDRFILCGGFRAMTDINGLSDKNYGKETGIVVGDELKAIDVKMPINLFINDEAYVYQNSCLNDGGQLAAIANSNQVMLYKDGSFYCVGHINGIPTGPRFIKFNQTDYEILQTVNCFYSTLNDETFYYTDEKTNDLISCEITGKLRKILNIKNDIENKDYDPVKGQFHVCDNDTYVFFTERNIKLVTPNY